MKFWAGAGLWLTALALAGCTTASMEARPSTSDARVRTASSSGSGPSGASVGSIRRNEQLPPPTLNQGNPREYLIGPLDIITVSVFQAPDLTGEFQIGSDGTITMPLIGDVTASGRTSQQIQKDIAAKLKVSYMQSPQVTVRVKEFNSQKVTVDGAVEKPGSFPVTAGGGTLLDFIAQAGGLPRTADPSGVLIFRQVGNEKLVGHYDVSAIRTGQTVNPLVYGGDKIVVAQSGIRSAWSDLIGAIPLASFAVSAGL